MPMTPLWWLLCETQALKLQLRSPSATLVSGVTFWGMKQNERNTETMIVSQSCTMHPQSPILIIEGIVLKSLLTLINWERHLIPRWVLRSIFTRFPEQLLECFLYWGSPGEHLMIKCSLRDASRVLSCSFCRTIFQCGALLPIQTN